MTILVVSDTHGSIEATLRYILSSEEPIDEIWHLGDYYKDAMDIAAQVNIPVLAVKGNGDVFSEGAESLLINRMGYLIYLTHGHHYGVKSSLQRLAYYCKEKSVQLSCFGHTHCSQKETDHDLVLFNPGSASRPYPGQLPVVGVIQLLENGIETRWEVV